MHINVRSTTRRVSARWKGGRIHVEAPVGIAYDDLLAILRDFAPRMQAIKPQSLYHLGQTLDFGEFRAVIQSQDYKPEHILASFRDGMATISVGTSWDMESADTMRNISKFLCRAAQNIAPSVLIPRARVLADTVGKRPMMWTISNGHRVLGHCNAHGIIALSYALMFYPPHLRDFVIYHELAHLSEMNHSPAFHAICDSYCSGREAELSAELRAYHIPIIK